MAFPYSARYGGGFVDLPGQTTAIDQVFLNAVEAALIALCAVAPSADQLPIWNNANSRFEPGKIADAQVAAGAALQISKLAGYPADVTKELRGDGTWASAGLDGWTAMSQTLTYSSVDGPTGVVTTGGVDLTGVIPVGSRLKFTQTTVKYFIVTAVSATTITLYGGTDYTLINAAITLPSFSLAKVPVGFNATPAKWTELIRDTSSRLQATPASGTWYNLGAGALSMSIPIGSWAVTYMATLDGRQSATGDALADIKSTLSTGATTESDVDATATFTNGGYTTVANDLIVMGTVARTVFLSLAAKTSYYLNLKTAVANMASIAFRGDVQSTIIRAVCAYL